MASEPKPHQPTTGLTGSRGWRPALQPTCCEMTAQSSLRLDHRSHWWQVPDEWLHLASCGVCRRYRRQLEWLHQAAKQADRKIERPTSLTQTPKDRIRQALRRVGPPPGGFPQPNLTLSTLQPMTETESGDALDREEFWKVFHNCSGKLPDRIARVFLLREVDRIPSDEICATLNISPNTLWGMLHRARMALRRCMEVHWLNINSGEAE